MSVDVKICGLSEARHVDAAVEAGARLTGFVFFDRSPRHVGINDAAALTARVPADIRKVALTVDAADDELTAIVGGAGIDTLQLHGHEDPARVRQVRDMFGLPVIKALPISTPDDVAAVADFEAVADMLLFDAKPPKGATRPGGNAATFDWDLLSGANFQVPWLLAGGLTPENVGEAVVRTGARMVDVSSGVEDAPGKKSAQKIHLFIQAVNNAAAR